MRRADGFTLLELVVAVLVLALLAAVAGPRMFDASRRAKHVALLLNLSVVRQAVDEFKLKNGFYPGKDGTEATFKNDLKSVLRGNFPHCSVGADNAEVKITATAGGQGITGEATPTKGWHYHNKKGTFIVNWTGLSDEGVAYDRY